MSDSTQTRTAQTKRSPGKGFIDNRQLDQIWRLLRNMISTDSSLLEITYSQRGIQFTPKASRRRAKSVTEDSVEVLSTPFLGEVHDDGDKITVGAARGDADYIYRDTITVGLDTLHKTVAEDSPVITTTSFVWYKITKSGTTITAVLEAGATYPTQVHGELYIVLGKAIFDSGAITEWGQYHFGDISEHARFG